MSGDTLNETNVRVCACGQMYCLHFPSRSGQLPLSGREIKKQDNYKPTTRASQLLKVSKKKMSRRSVVDVYNIRLGEHGG